MAHADLDISEEETRAMEEIVVKDSELSPDLAIIVVQMAKSQNLLFGGQQGVFFDSLQDDNGGIGDGIHH